MIDRGGLIDVVIAGREIRNPLKPSEAGPGVER
jgi:hypothetical protein